MPKPASATTPTAMPRKGLGMGTNSGRNTGMFGAGLREVTRSGSERQRLPSEDQRGGAAEHDQRAGKHNRIDAARGSGERSGKSNGAVHSPHNRRKMLTKG